MATESATNDPIPIWVPNEWNELKSAVMRKSADQESDELLDDMQELVLYLNNVSYRNELCEIAFFDKLKLLSNW